MIPFEILKRFQANHADIVRDMKNANHNYSSRDLNSYHLEGDVWTHTMMVFNYAVQKNFPPEVLLAALFHDIGKGYTLSTKIKNSSGVVYTSFHGHDGVSFYRCLDVMKKSYADVLTKSQISTISKLVANHSVLYSWQNNTKQSKEEWVKSAFAGESDFLTLLSNLVESDAMGRVAENPSRPEDFRIYRDFVTYQEKLSVEKKPKLTVLIGPPSSGKSTWVEKNVDDEVVVISSDDILMELGSSDSYDENWKNVDFLQVETIMMKKFHSAVKNNKDIVIVRTNMSKKSRRKFLNPVRGKYETFAVVFETGHNEMNYRNVNRSSVIEKTIPSNVQFNMEKAFVYPLLDEFDFVN